MKLFSFDKVTSGSGFGCFLSAMLLLIVGGGAILIWPISIYGVLSGEFSQGWLWLISAIITPILVGIFFEANSNSTYIISLILTTIVSTIVAQLSIGDGILECLFLSFLLSIGSSYLSFISDAIMSKNK